MVSKITFSSYSDSAYSGNALKTMSAVINPDSYSQTQEIRYKSAAPINDPQQTNNFDKLGNHTLKLPKLIVDGTGIVPLEGAKSVDDYLDQLAATVYEYQGNIHRPPFVKISWGTLIFKGVCTTWSVSYTLFDSTGNALRATVSLDFKSTVDPKTKAAQAKQSSPDLTHARVVKAGDTLPLMTYRIYGDSTYYLEVARLNGLNSPNAIAPGDTLYFPPLKK